ncbi:MAG: hypothetical protein U9Q34_04660 [Elusimicrobiota bacterium]|nr:hypothetical protein [Elusimicrobiota bacterium]
MANDNTSAKEEIQNFEKNIENRKRDNKKIIENNTKRKENLKKAAVFLKIFILIALAAYFYTLIPRLTLALKPLRPLRMGTYHTDKTTDKCIANIWRIASGDSPEITCPETNAPYKQDEKGIYCPNPQKHGLVDIYFDKTKKHVMVKNYD